MISDLLNRDRRSRNKHLVEKYVVFLVFEIRNIENQESGKQTKLLTRNDNSDFQDSKY